MKDIDYSVIQHILSSSTERYTEILEKTKAGMGDPFDRSISLAFELVLQHHLDPWAIDLAKFSSLYIKRAKKERIDLVVAGKILYMAWKILNMQSYDVIINAEEVPSWDEYEEEQPSKMVVDEVPIVEPVRRRVNRRVSLIELIEAFDRARKEAEEYQVLEKLRRKERARILAEAQTRMHRSVHEEHFEDEIREVWKRIRKFNGRAIPLSNLCNFEDEEDRIITFVAVLHLANDGKIRIYQRKFPFGKIYVRCWDWKKRLG